MPHTTGTRSIPDLFRDLANQLTTLARKEGQLARVEVSEKINQVGYGLALVVGGAVLLMPALVVLLNAIVAAMVDSGIEAHWAALAVGGITLLIGIVLLATGISRFKADRLVPNKTIDQLQQDATVAKHQMRQEHDLQRAA